MKTRRCCLLTHLLLFCTIVWESSAVLGPGGYTPPSGNTREKPKCLPQCYCLGHSIECDSWSGESVHLLPKTTTALSIRNYPDVHFNTTIFGYIPEIQWLKLSPGRLEQFPDITKLSKLSFLDVSENKIEKLPSKAIIGLNQLAHLNLSSNSLKSLDIEFLNNLNFLKILDLSKNYFLSSIPNNLLASNLELNYLDLSFLDLKIVPKSILNMPKLYYLNLSSNALTVIPQMQHPNLEILDVSHNLLKSIPDISHMHNLVRLYATHTNIVNLEESTFSLCSNLRILDVRASNITNLDGGPLRNCRNLEELRFSDSVNLWRLEDEAFDGLQNLQRLFIENCPALHELEREAMNNVPNLKELYLQDSSLEVLPKSLQNLNLTNVNLKNVRLRCDCNAFWIPEWISRLNKLNQGDLNSIKCLDNTEKTKEELKRHIETLNCMDVEVISPKNEWVLAPWGQSALLDCNTTGSPSPNIIWQTSKHDLLVYSIRNQQEWFGHQIKQALSKAKITSNGKYQVLQSGKLLIKEVQREDIGRYKCFAYNEMSNASAVTFLGLQDTQFRAYVQESMLFGFLCAALFLFITLLLQFIKYMMDRLGCECCCCCRNRLSPKAKQIRQLLESVEAYKSAQLEKLRENYNSQVVYIKDSCYQQMEKIRDSYAQQSKNLKELRDYSTQQLSGARDQYVDQVNKVRDYSLGQMNRVRENYVFQRQRIRKFSAHQLLKLRETYKYQQKTLNKLLETLPDFYIQNCRTGSCQRTDSIIFDELEGLDVYYKVDFLDNTSMSDYYTPSSTLTRQPKGNRSHSRNPSATSGCTEYLEAHPYISRKDSVKGESGTKLHGRSYSLAMPPTAIHKPEVLKGHKRSQSASQSSPQAFHPKLTLVEEPTSPPPSPLSPEQNPTISNSNSQTPLYTPLPSPTPITPDHMGSQEVFEIKNENQLVLATSSSDVCTVSEILSKSTESVNEEWKIVGGDEDSADETESGHSLLETKPSISYETSL